MTSQVVVMNMDAIAIASDTILTVRGQDDYKALPDWGKIVDFDGSHKVVGMLSGKLSINELSARKALQWWSEGLGSSQLSSFEDYPTSFIQWAKSNTKMADSESQISIVESRLSPLFEKWEADIRSLANELKVNVWAVSKDGEYGVNPQYLRAANAMAVKYLKNVLQGVESRSDLGCVDSDAVIAWTKSDEYYQAAFEEWIAEFDPFYLPFDKKFSKKITELLSCICALTLTKEVGPGESVTTGKIAFVGYGADDVFPSYGDVEIIGYYADTFIYIIPANKGSAYNALFEVEQANMETVAKVKLLAQQDAIIGFLNGTSITNFWALDRETTETLDHIFENHVDKEKFHARGLTKSQFISDYKETIVGTQLHLDDGLTPNFRQTIAALGLSSLSDLAETLVKLQALASYNEAGSATVGGLIELATIDKKFGLRWIRRLPIPQ